MEIIKEDTTSQKGLLESQNKEPKTNTKKKINNQQSTGGGGRDKKRRDKSMVAALRNTKAGPFRRKNGSKVMGAINKPPSIAVGSKPASLVFFSLQR